MNKVLIVILVALCIGVALLAFHLHRRSAPGSADAAPHADPAHGDPVIAALDQRFRGLRPVLQADVLTGLVRAVSAQQVNLRWAAITRARLALEVGVRHQVAVRLTLDTCRGQDIEMSRPCLDADVLRLSADRGDECERIVERSRNREYPPVRGEAQK